jgi:methionine-rich copper-binding protein CopC
MGSRLTRVIAALVFAVAGLSAAHLPNASAHADFDHSTPSDKQVFPSGQSPSQLSITFVSSVVPSPGTFAFVSNGDTDESAGPSTVSPTDPDTIILPLQANLPNGEYDVFWKSTDADDGGVSFGHFTFFVGNPSASDLSSAPAAVSLEVPDDATQNALNPVGTQPNGSDQGSSNTPASSSPNSNSTMPSSSTMPMGGSSSSSSTSSSSPSMPMSPGMPMGPASP